MRGRLASVLGKLIFWGITAGVVWLFTHVLRHWGVGSLPIALAVAVLLAGVAGIVFVLLVLLIIYILERLGALVSRCWRRIRRPWSHALLVDADHERGTFTPIVWIRGGLPLRGGRVRLRLIDGDDVVRAAGEAPLPAAALGKEMRLPPIALPPGATADEVLGWQWETSVRGRWRVRARWRERLMAADEINAEGELAGAPEPVEAPGRAGAPERSAAPDSAGVSRETRPPEEPLIHRFANAILAQAMDDEASDIRVVPQGDRVVVKFRLNGGYRHVLDAPLPVGRDLHGRLQEMFGLPRERGVAQRGALAASYAGRAVRFEGRSIPAEDGDVFHIRVLANDEGRGRAA